MILIHVFKQARITVIILKNQIKNTFLKIILKNYRHSAMCIVGSSIKILFHSLSSLPFRNQLLIVHLGLLKGNI